MHCIALTDVESIEEMVSVAILYNFPLTFLMDLVILACAFECVSMKK